MATLIGVDDKLVWVDCEMTGLDLTSDRLIEIAALVTDGDLNILGEGVDLVIHADDAALAAMPPVVQEMHARSGLTEEVRASTVTVREAEEAVLAYLREHIEAGAVPLAGNSIATDRRFIAKEMPELDRFAAAAENAYAAARDSIQARALLTGVAIFLISASVVGVMWYGAQGVLAGTMTAGQLSQFVLYAVFGASALGQLSEVYGELAQAAGAAERLRTEVHDVEVVR